MYSARYSSSYTCKQSIMDCLNWIYVHLLHSTEHCIMCFVLNAFTIPVNTLHLPFYHINTVYVIFLYLRKYKADHKINKEMYTMVFNWSIHTSYMITMLSIAVEQGIQQYAVVTFLQWFIFILLRGTLRFPKRSN